MPDNLFNAGKWSLWPKTVRTPLQIGGLYRSCCVTWRNELISRRDRRLPDSHKSGVVEDWRGENSLTRGRAMRRRNALTMTLDGSGLDVKRCVVCVSPSRTLLQPCLNARTHPPYSRLALARVAT